MRTKPNFVDLLLRHISTPAIVDVLVKLFSLIETAQADTRNALIDVRFSNVLFRFFYIYI